jgi:hypothetical protein
MPAFLHASLEPLLSAQRSERTRIKKPRPKGVCRTGARRFTGVKRKTANRAPLKWYMKWLIEKRPNNPQSAEVFRSPFGKKIST